jgi:drug/metabolite transporter (DMT)-like permease
VAARGVSVRSLGNLPGAPRGHPQDTTLFVVKEQIWPANVSRAAAPGLLLGSCLWVVFTIAAAAAQTVRNALQKELTAMLGTVGATHVRFLFGLPFGLLFLGLVVAATGQAPPAFNAAMVGWTMLAALAQIGGTALLLAAMRERSFVVSTAYAKTEPVQVAVFGVAFLGEQLSTGAAIAILIATLGVMVMSWPKHTASALFSWRPAALGIASGALFAVAAVGFRGAIKALYAPNFVLAASLTLALSLLTQTVVLSLYLLAREWANLMAIFRIWRQSIWAGFMGALASQFWFLAFALETAAKVRTLALIEILFAQIVSRRMFEQRLAPREVVGIFLVLAGIALLLNA